MSLIKWSEDIIQNALAEYVSNYYIRALTEIKPKSKPNLISIAFAPVSKTSIIITKLESWHPDAYHPLIINLIEEAQRRNKNLIVKIREEETDLLYLFRGHFPAKYTGKRTVSFDLFRRLPKTS